VDDYPQLRQPREARLEIPPETKRANRKMVHLIRPSSARNKRKSAFQTKC